jgi:hypothetical protein
MKILQSNFMLSEGGAITHLAGFKIKGPHMKRGGISAET